MEKYKNPVYKKVWFMALISVLFPVVGLYLMWKFKKNWNKIIKIILTAIASVWLLFLLVFCFAMGSDSAVVTDEVDYSTTENSIKKEISTENSVITEIIKPTSTTTTDTTESTANTTTTTTKPTTTTTKPSTTTTKPTTTTTTKATTTTTTKATTTTTKPTTTTTKSTTTTTKPTTTTTKATTTTTKATTTTTKKTTTTTTKATTTTKKVTTTQNLDAGVTVYITETGKRYHYENPCGNGKYYPVTLEEAKSLGLTPCDKCVLH